MKRRIVSTTLFWRLEVFPCPQYTIGKCCPLVAWTSIGVEPAHEKRHVRAELPRTRFGCCSENAVAVTAGKKHDLFDVEFSGIFDIVFASFQSDSPLAADYVVSGNDGQEHVNTIGQIG